MVDKPLEIHGNLLARNAIINTLGLVAPVIIGIICIPLIIEGLGTERFGVLSLTWVVLGYFSIFNLGLGRATTRFVAEALGRGEEGKVTCMVWTSLVVHIALGVVGSILLALVTPILVREVFKIPPSIVTEAEGAFYILSLSVMVILASTSLRSVLEAAQRFDLINMVRIPFFSMTFLLPLLGIALGYGLRGIVLLLTLAMFCNVVAYLLLCLKVLPALRKGFSLDIRLMIPMFCYGGWVTVSNVVNPLLVYLDRFIIGSVLSMSAVAYYTAPYEVVTRLIIIPSSLAMVLFPAFSAIGPEDRDTLAAIYTRSIKHTLLVVGPIVVVMMMFAEEIIRLWLGPEFSVKSTSVLQILAVGVMANALAQFPFGLLQGLGRPDVPARFHLFELMLYVPLMWFMVRKLGITGGALAWSLRVWLDAILLFTASWRLYNLGPYIFVGTGVIRSIATLGMLFFTMFTILPLSENLLTRLVFAFFILVMFFSTSWRYVLDQDDKGFIKAAVRRIFRRRVL